MKNRAKCKLCGDIIESFHRHDYVSCGCGEISVDGGTDYMRCRATNWANFLRVDDNGNIIVPKIVDSAPLIESKPVLEEPKVKKPSRIELKAMLNDMIKSIEGLPQNAMSTHINHYDLLSLLLLLSALFASEDTCKADI